MPNKDGSKSGGRKKGSLNAVTKEIRQAITNVVKGEIDQGRLEKALESVYNKDKERYIYAIVALGKQVLAAMMALKVEDETKKEEIKEIVVVKAEEAQVIETKKD